MSRGTLSTTAGIIAVVTALGATTYLVLFSIYLISARASASIIAVVASVFQVMALTFLAYMVFQGTFKHVRFVVEMGSRRLKLHLLVPLAVLLSAAAGGLSLAAFTWTKISCAEVPKQMFGESADQQLMIAFVLCGASILSQAIFYISLSWIRNQHIKPEIYPVQSNHSTPGVKEVERPETARRKLIFEEIPGDQPGLSPPETPVMAETDSRLPSMSSIARSNSSRSQLIRNHSHARNCNSIPGRPSHDSGFDVWDTTDVASTIRENVLRNKSITVPVLSPIPGSRSPSPADALEGPFHRRERSPPPTPPRNNSQTNFSRPGGRKRVSSSNEENIHPLFRASSPTPPPSATRGTMVTAAPIAERIITEQTLGRMRAGSLPSSPTTPKTPSAIFRPQSPPTPHAPGYFDVPGFRPQSKSFLADYESTIGGPSRVTSPPNGTRSLTPPFPEYVQSAGNSPTEKIPEARKPDFGFI
ncbi:hypothetical protein MMC09_002761 [Bachmanniomyces sp. S44760]|nr:hypothetical protein [Bachmanniomyces sp. S44760]